MDSAPDVEGMATGPPAVARPDRSLGQRNQLFALARQAERLPSLPVVIFYTIAIVVGSGVVALIPLIILAPAGLSLAGMPAMAATNSAAESGLRLAIILLASFGPFYLFIWLWLRFYERRPFATLGFQSGNVVGQALRGLLVALLMFGGAVAVLAASGTVAPADAPAHLQGWPALGGVALAALGWAVQGPAEEVLCRGWQLPVIGARYGVWTGVALSSLIFTVLHSLNPNVTPLAILNLFLVGLFLALYALREGGIWGVCAWHTGWNWAQGNLFGFDVSGMSVTAGALVNLRGTGPDWLTGGAFGPEGGSAVTIALVAGNAVLLLWRWR